MLRNLRSVVAQVPRESRCVGSRRSFSTETTQNDWSWSLPFPLWICTRGVALVSGIAAGSYMLGDIVSNLKEDLDKSLKEKEEDLKQREKHWSEIIASSKA